MDYELALGVINEYIGWCERSLWLRRNESGPQSLRERRRFVAVSPTMILSQVRS